MVCLKLDLLFKIGSAGEMETNLKTVPAFLEKVLNQLDTLNINHSNLEIDHVCFRTETQKEYEMRKNELSGISALLIESMVGGRLISVYKLHDPIIYGSRKIALIELPSPKAGSHYPSGWEHCEMVVESIHKLMKVEHPELKWKTSGMGKEINPELGLKLEGGISVKFHEQSLEKVIELELAANAC